MAVICCVGCVGCILSSILSSILIGILGIILGCVGCILRIVIGLVTNNLLTLRYIDSIQCDIKIRWDISNGCIFLAGNLKLVDVRWQTIASVT